MSLQLQLSQAQIGENVDVMWNQVSISPTFLLVHSSFLQNKFSKLLFAYSLGL